MEILMPLLFIGGGLIAIFYLRPKRAARATKGQKESTTAMFTIAFPFLACWGSVEISCGRNNSTK